MKTTAKYVGIGLLVVLTVGGVIFGAWRLEEYSKQIKTVVVEQPGGHMFVVELEEKDGGTVFIQCDEDEFEEAFTQFRRFLNIEGPPLSVPGGPMILAQAPTKLVKDLQPAQRALIEILRRHSPRRIILLAHSDCLLYDTMAAWQDQLSSVKGRQFDDLRQAVSAIKTWLPKSEVQVYYALKDGKVLKFNPADLTVRPTPGERAPISGASGLP